MTKGEQSVKAMMPTLTLGISGASEAPAAVAAQDRWPREAQSAAAPVRPAPRVRNWRRLREAASVGPDGAAAGVLLGVGFMMVWIEFERFAMEVFAKESAG